MVPAGSFAHIDARSSLPNVLTQGKCSSPCNPGSPPPVLPAPGLCPASLPEHCQARLWLWRWPPKLQALCSIVYLKKKKKIFFFLVNGFGGTVFLWSLLCVCSLFFSCVFSYYSLHYQGYLPSAVPTALFFHKSTLHSSYLPQVIFAICRHAALFSKTSERFLGCSEWFGIYSIMFKRRSKLRVTTPPPS